MKVLNILLIIALTVWVNNFFVLRNKYVDVQKKYAITLEEYKLTLIDYLELQKLYINNK